MFDFIKLDQTPLVGIDISSSAIKVLELARVNGQYVVETYGIALLAPQIVVDKNIKQIDKVADSIRHLIKRSNVASKFAAVSVSGTSAITRVVQMNIEYGDVQIADQIEAEAERYFPFPIDEVYYDFERLGPYLKNPELADILVAAARVEAVDARVAAITEAGLKPAVVDIETLAVERAFALVVRHLGESGKTYNFALVDIGATSSTLYVFQQLKIIYSREQTFGGKHLTDEIQRRYGLSSEEAVTAQKYGGLPDDYMEEVLLPFKETIVQQVSRSLQIFTSSSDETEIHYVVLAGGVAKLHGLDTLIQNQLKIKTFVANPFLEVEVSSKVDKTALFDEAPGLMVACGLALRNFDNEQN